MILGRKHQQLAASVLPADGAAKVLAMLPRAAEIYCKQIVLGIDGHPEATGRESTDLLDGEADGKADLMKELIKCPDCGRFLLNTAIVCPYCGASNTSGNAFGIA